MAGTVPKSLFTEGNIPRPPIFSRHPKNRPARFPKHVEDFAPANARVAIQDTLPGFTLWIVPPPEATNVSYEPISAPQTQGYVNFEGTVKSEQETTDDLHLSEAQPLEVNLPEQAVDLAQEESKILLLQRQYQLRNSDEVFQFLQENPHLIELLLEAYSKIGHHFPGSPIFLEVAFDPEVGDRGELVASIATKLKPKEAIEKLNQFDDDWWLDASDVSGGKLSIGLEFR